MEGEWELEVKVAGVLWLGNGMLLLGMGMGMGMGMLRSMVLLGGRL